MWFQTEQNELVNLQKCQCVRVERTRDGFDVVAIGDTDYDKGEPLRNARTLGVFITQQDANALLERIGKKLQAMTLEPPKQVAFRPL